MEELRGLSCLVCYNAFSSINDSNIPRNLICGHSFCTACLEKLSQQCHRLYVQCPTCKCQTLLQHGIKSLPKNFGVLEIIESREGGQSACTSFGKNKHKDKNKDNTRHKCEEHDEEKKVYCYTDECLICIYCQIYGKHQGHKCELASDQAKSSRTELENMAEKLQNEIAKMNKGIESLAVVKTSVINRQRFLSETIKKYMSIIQHYLSIQEGKLLNSVTDMSSCKLQALMAQEKTLQEFSMRCEELYLLIKTLQTDSDSSVIEERPTIEKLVDGMLSVSHACQIKPQAQNTLMFKCSDDIIKNLDKYIGTIEQTDKDDEQNDSSDEELFLKNVIQKLEKEAFENVENDILESQQQEEHSEVESESEEEEEEEDVEDEEEIEEEDEDSSEEDEETLEEEDQDEENESRAEAEDDEPTSEGELIGAVGGNMLPEAQQDEGPKHDKEINKKQGLLRELQHEIERLKLLGPRGDIIRVVDDTSSSSDSENETADGPNTRSLQLDLQITVNNDLGGARSRSRATSASSRMEDLLTVANNRLPRDRKTEPNYHKRKQCSVNCQHHLKPTLQCKKCCRVFCKNCASVSLHCSKSEKGHDYVSYGQDSTQRKHTKSRRKLQWECKRCTMVNESHVLVCGACETSKDFDPNEVRNVCPMCTLVNEPGKTNCELCDTDLEECFN